MHQKDSFFTLKTLPQRCGFFTHRRTHMRACSLHRRTLEHACPSYSRTQERACPTHRRALVHACSHHRRAPKARLKFLLSRIHARVFSGQARTYAHLPPDRPRMWAHILSKNLLKPPIRPPVPTLPKNWKPISMQDDQTTNLKLAERRSTASSSLNHQISSEIYSSSHFCSRYK
jgi:hypothetical protein